MAGDGNHRPEDTSDPASWIAPTHHGSDPELDIGDRLHERARTWDREARARYRGGDRVRAAAAWERCVSLYRAAGVSDKLAATLVNLGTCYRDLLQFPIAANRAGEARRIAEADGLRAILVRSLDVLVDCALQEGRWEDAAALLEAQPAPLRPSTLRRWAILAVRTGRPDAVEFARRAVDAARDAGERRETARAVGVLAAALALAGREQEVRRVLEEGARLAEQLPEAYGAAELGLWGAEALEHLGLLDEARVRAEQVSLYAEDAGLRLLARDANRLVERVRERLAVNVQRERLRTLVRLAAEVGRAPAPELLLDRVARVALRLVEVDRVFVVSGTADDWRVMAAVAREGGAPGRPVASVVRLVLGHGREVVIQEGAGVDPRVSVSELLPASILCVPLPTEHPLRGAIYVDSVVPFPDAGRDQLELLEALAAFAAVALAHAAQLRRELDLVERLRQVVHDIRHHATAAGLWLEAAREEAPDGYDLEPIQTAREALEGITEAAGAILEGRELAEEHIDLGQCVRRVVQLHREQALAVGVAIRLEVAEGAKVAGRRSELRRLVTNLLVNALKFSPEGGEIEVRVDADDRWARFTVADRGPGIPEEKLDAVFAPGVVLDHGKPGFGLGLSIVRRLVKEWGGTVDARNRVGGGALFLVRLPLVRD